MAVSEQIVPCWQCRYCLTGKYWMCAVHDIYGFRRRTPGAMAEYLRFPAGALNHKVPAGMPAHHAVFIEPLACSIHAVQRGEIEFQDVVVIAGAGPLGLGMVAAARMKQPGAADRDRPQRRPAGDGAGAAAPTSASTRPRSTWSTR